MALLQQQLPQLDEICTRDCCKVDIGVARSAGLITSAGAIDIVIPPSIAMILYGIAAEQSIPKLFVAGIIPGFLIAVLMAVYISVSAWIMRLPTEEILI